MNAIRPQATFSQEWELIVRPEISGDPVISRRQFSAMGSLMMQGWRTGKAADEGSCLRVGVTEGRIGSLRIAPSSDPRTDAQLLAMLKDLGMLLPFRPSGPPDRVLGLEDLDHGTHPTGAVYPHFQRWLTATNIGEDAARHCISAMALPFGPEQHNNAVRSFGYAPGIGRSEHLGVSAQPGSFHFTREPGADDDFIAVEGDVVWRWPQLQTLGNCACWGINGREGLWIGPETGDALYRLDGHNIDTPKQALSILLGGAALADAASRYEGEEDVFANARVVPVVG
ncbi:MAG TPA: hypothetical protein VGS28_00085 [Candidatus Saccharimonadales bacterium]|nr:hypothetical protein [Candidatus Saccharimonadales bacterium]